MIIVKLKQAGVHRVLDGVAGMTFPVDSFTKSMNVGYVAHVRDYRYKHDNVKGSYQIWSISSDGYEIINSSFIGDGETTYSIEDVEASRKGLIELRDAALKVPMFDWAVLLSHTIAMLAVMKREIWGNDK